MPMPYELDNYENAETVSLKKGAILIYETEVEDAVWFTCTTMLIGKKALETEDAMGCTEYGSVSQMLQEGLIEKVLPAENPVQNHRKAHPMAAPIKDKQVLEEALPAPYMVRRHKHEQTLPGAIREDDLTLDEVLTAAPLAERVLAEVLKTPPVKNARPPKETLSPDQPIDVEYMPDEAPPEYGSFETIRKTFEMLKSTISDIAHVFSYTNPGRIDGIRTLKVIESSYPVSFGAYHFVPHIRLAGRWIERAGFNRGDFVQVITIKGMVLVVPVAPAPDFEEAI